MYIRRQNIIYGSNACQTTSVEKIEHINEVYSKYARIFYSTKILVIYIYLYIEIYMFNMREQMIEVLPDAMD